MVHHLQRVLRVPSGDTRSRLRPIVARAARAGAPARTDPSLLPALLIDLLSRGERASAARWVARVVREFAHGKAQFDDIACLGLMR
jgi:hypothetical protein